MSKRKKPKKQDLDMNLLSKINKNAAEIDIGADRPKDKCACKQG